MRGCQQCQNGLHEVPAGLLLNVIGQDPVQQVIKFKQYLAFATRSPSVHILIGCGDLLPLEIVVGQQHIDQCLVMAFCAGLITRDQSVDH